MKNLLLAFSSVVVSASLGLAATGSGFDRLEEGRYTLANLDHCNGTVQLKETVRGGVRSPKLVFEGVTHCSVIYINGVKSKETISKNDDGRLEVIIYELPGINLHTIRLESQSGKTSDTVQVVSFGLRKDSVPHTTYQRPNIVMEFGLASWLFGNEKIVDLYECKGTLRVNVEGNLVRLTFNNVRSCSKFDILSSNGDAVNYSTKNLQLARDDRYDGSFTIPKNLIDAGGNGLKVVLKSNSGKTDEVILIRFLAL